MFALVHLHFIRRRRTYEHLGKRVKRKDAGMDKWVNVFARFCIEACILRMHFIRGRDSDSDSVPCTTAYAGTQVLFRYSIEFQC